MLPIVIDVKRCAIALIGHGPQTEKRLASLDAAKAVHVKVFAPDPSAALAAAAGGRWVPHWPAPADFETVSLAMVGDIPPEQAERFFVMGRAKGVLVNVEDQRAYCDFHVPSVFRRGDLLISVSTGGRSPALAQMIKARIGLAFGPEWEGHLDAIADLRAGWRDAGLSPPEISKRTEAAAAAAGWFDAAGTLALPTIDISKKASP